MIKFTKKTYIIIFVAVAVVIGIAVILYFVFREPKVEDPNKSNTPVPPDSPTPKWVPETFPLNVGMYGPKIKAMQKILGVSADGKLGQITKASLIAKGYSVPLSTSDYNFIISSDGGNASSNIPGAYAKYNNTIVRDINLNEKRKLAKDTYIGTVTGENIISSQTYYEIDGFEYVIKTSTYLKG